MNWGSFLIGVLVGALIGLLIGYLIWYRRLQDTCATLRNRLEGSTREYTMCQARLADFEGVQGRLDSSVAEIGILQDKLAEMGAVQGRLDSSVAEIGILKDKLAGMEDLQGRLDGAQGQISVLEARLSDATAHSGELEVRLTSANAELEVVKDELGALESARAELAACKAQTAVPRESAGGREDAAPAAPQAAVECTAIVPDNLMRIEGIGPKISSLLNEAGILTFAQLAATSVERLREILTGGGPRFSVSDPGTWPEQAALARDGKWDALKALQSVLSGGRRLS